MPAAKKNTPAAPKKRPRSTGLSKARAAQIAKTAAVVGGAALFAMDYAMAKDAEAKAKGEKSNMPAFLVKPGYGQAAIVAAAGYFLAGREKDAAKGAGIRAGAFAAAAMLAVSHYSAEKKKAAGQTPVNGLLTYNPQHAGAYMRPVGEQGRPSADLGPSGGRRVRQIHVAA